MKCNRAIDRAAFAIAKSEYLKKEQKAFSEAVENSVNGGMWSGEVEMDYDMNFWKEQSKKFSETIEELREAEANAALCAELAEKVGDLVKDEPKQAVPDYQGEIDYQRKENEELKDHIRRQNEKIARLEGIIEGMEKRPAPYYPIWQVPTSPSTDPLNPHSPPYYEGPVCNGSGITIDENDCGIELTIAKKRTTS